jgi:uncharacterized protein YbjQ (UPF0145 family)
MEQLIRFVLLILLGWIVGRTAERRHFLRLERRERELAHMLVTDVKTFPGGADPSKRAALVHGEAVIATDYLKSFLAALRKLVGGELRSYESLMTRARREAVVRMLEEAHRLGYDAVCNLRLGSADIGGMTGKRGAAMVEAFAWGTAYARAAESAHAQATV